ncbi:uncharacterized protein Dsimw501_GD29536 [Drosophila simulans]|uniref:Uncharacterized protein n=1 Tax=Drosophila simulans TaxID=7240 RepID=A0A0J9R2D2_DROSI|nr:uncharacterized protein Dsimw501_GD29536 [Drosophila simulans]
MYRFTRLHSWRPSGLEARTQRENGRGAGLRPGSGPWSLVPQVETPESSSSLFVAPLQFRLLSLYFYLINFIGLPCQATGSGGWRHRRLNCKAVGRQHLDNDLLSPASKEETDMEEQEGSRR